MILNKRAAYRVRWWNIAYSITILAGIILVFIVLINPELKSGFTGNLLGEIIGFCIGLLITYIVYQRFRYERFKTLIGYSGFEEPFIVLQKLSVKFISYCDLSATHAKSSLSAEEIRELKKCFEIINTKVNLYNRFLTLEELREIDICLTNVIILSEIDKDMEDNAFMEQFVSAIQLIYIKSHVLLDNMTDPEVLSHLNNLYRDYCIESYNKKHQTIRPSN